MYFSYLCPKRGMVGESWIVDVILAGELNEESMVQDFGIVKKQLKGLIDQYVDHKLLVPAEHAYSQITHRDKNMVQVSFQRPDERAIHMYCPDEAYGFIYADEINMESVGAYLKDVLAIHLPDNVDDIQLLLRAEVITTPFYHYTHGLKKHDGNCQRIAHGHRSKITIIENGSENLAEEAYWAKRWADIYIGSTEDQVTIGQLQCDYGDVTDATHTAFAYESSQGYFEMAISHEECEVIDRDSTVECLAQYLLEEQTKRSTAEQIQVIAFEGVGKGAIVQTSR
jgi:6-pyruvoyl-tetrahydropterin synthase